MDDLGYLGAVELGGDLPVALPCRNASLVPTAPTGTPAYTIYDSEFSSVDTGTLGAADTDSKTGFRTGTHTVSAGNGFASGGFYTILITYVVSGSNRNAIGTFRVT